MDGCSSRTAREYYYFVQTGDSLFRIIKQIYGSSISQAKLLELSTVVLQNNPQIKDPNLLYAGQCLDLTPYRKPDFEISRWKTDASYASSAWTKLSPDEKEGSKPTRM